jgi:hypothetical protein
MLGSDQLEHRPAPSAPRAEPDDVADDVEVEAFRDIHPEPSPPHLPPPPLRQPSWDAASHRSLSSSGAGGGGDVELFATMSREFTAMVAAGSSSAPSPDVPGDAPAAADLNLLQLARIGENEPAAEANALAIVPAAAGSGPPAPVEQVKKEEVEAKVAAWQAEEVAKINNKFKREEVVINGWESQQVDKATAWLAKIEVKKTN